MIQVAFCMKGDIFVYRDGHRYWSPIGTNFESELAKRFVVRIDVPDMDAAIDYVKRELHWHDHAAVYVRQLGWVRHQMERPHPDESGILYVPIDARRELAQ